MQNVDVGWEVDGIISAEQSVAGMLRVVESKNIQDTGTFWTWEGVVRLSKISACVNQANFSQRHPW